MGSVISMEPAFKSRFRDNSCRHDGECISSGCGYACLSVVHTGHLLFTCEAHPEIEAALEDHFCGRSPALGVLTAWLTASPSTA